MLDEVSSFAEDAKCFGDVAHLVKEYGCFGAYVQDAGVGEAVIEIPFDKGLYMRTLSDAAGIELNSDAELYKTVTELCAVKREYDKLRDALRDVKECGWGVVMPCEGDLAISEPQLVRAGSQWGVRVGASAEAIHLVRTSIRTDVSPAVGTEEQAAEVAKQLAADYENDPVSLLDSKLFGKSMSDLVSEGIAAKLSHMPPEARQRMGGTIERIINEGASGLICILV